MVLTQSALFADLLEVVPEIHCPVCQGFADAQGCGPEAVGRVLLGPNFDLGHRLFLPRPVLLKPGAT